VNAWLLALPAALVLVFAAFWPRAWDFHDDVPSEDDAPRMRRQIRGWRT
jgi:hypothetical protein